MTSSAPRHSRITFSDRLLAEALRLREEDGRQPIDDPLADLHAQAVEGDLEAKIIMRARSAQIANQLRHALRQFRAAIGWMVMLGLVVAFVLGAAAARATLGTGAGERNLVNFYWVLGGVLGVQTIALIAWLIVMMVASVQSRRDAKHEGATITAGSVISLGAAVVGAAHWLAKKLVRDHHQLAAISAAARVHSSGPLGRWTFSSITHALWLAFNVGCIVFIVLLLTARHYTFVWETTILRSEQYVALTRAIAYVPDRLRILTPDREQIRNSQWPPPPDAFPGAPEQAREAWSGLLVGSVVVYGFGPRILLLAFSLGKRRIARRRFRLDATLPGFARLAPILDPQVASIGKITSDGEAAHDALSRPIAPERRGAPRPTSSSHAIMGVEIVRPAASGGWPPTVHGIIWDDFGIIEGRDDQREVLSRLESSPTEPASALIVCALTSTPDRGIARFIIDVRARIARPIILLLTAGHALRERGYSADEIAQRVQDWRQLAKRAGIEDDRVLEQDIDHLTESARKRLKDALAAGDESARPSGAAERRIEQAFSLIVEEAQKWSASGPPPALEAQAELHRRIAQLYGSGAPQRSWRDLIGAPSSITGDIAQNLRAGAQRVQSLLPDRLRRSPKWLAAGALSGALGCIAAATFISPVAIGALPMWSAIGAGIAAIWQPFARAQKEDQAAPAESPALGDAVRSAALFALLLELQGRDEATITRLLDEAIGPNEEPHLDSPDAVKSWLDGVRHRLDLKLAGAAP